MASEPADAFPTSRLMPGKFAWAFIAAGIVMVVVVRLMGLVDMPWPLGDPAVRNILTLLFGFIAVATAWVWFVFFSGYSVLARRWVLGGTMGLILFALAMFRLVEVNGSMVPSFAVRWWWQAPDQTIGRWESSGAGPIDLTTTTSTDFPQFLG